MDVKVLGPGCARCKTLEKAVFNALAELDIAASVNKVEDVVKIMEYGVMSTPALVINEKVIFSGRIPSHSDLKEMLNKNK